MDETPEDNSKGGYPVPPPKDTGFSPLDSDNWKEWHKDRRKWEAQQKAAAENPES
jgi:hypothetical protein